MPMLLGRTWQNLASFCAGTGCARLSWASHVHLDQMRSRRHIEQRPWSGSVLCFYWCTAGRLQFFLGYGHLKANHLPSDLVDVDWFTSIAKKTVQRQGIIRTRLAGASATRFWTPQFLVRKWQHVATMLICVYPVYLKIGHPKNLSSL